jgi:hypothetical protein
MNFVELKQCSAGETGALLNSVQSILDEEFVDRLFTFGATRDARGPLLTVVRV